MQALKECFETKNVAMLQKVLSELPQDQAAYHMDRCVKSGLWVSDAKAAGITRHILLEVVVILKV